MLTSAPDSAFRADAGAHRTTRPNDGVTAWPSDTERYFRVRSGDRNGQSVRGATRGAGSWLRRPTCRSGASSDAQRCMCNLRFWRGAIDVPFRVTRSVASPAPFCDTSAVWVPRL